MDQTQEREPRYETRELLRARPKVANEKTAEIDAMLIVAYLSDGKRGVVRRASELGFGTGLKGLDRLIWMTEQGTKYQALVAMKVEDLR